MSAATLQAQEIKQLSFSYPWFLKLLFDFWLFRWSAGRWRPQNCSPKLLIPRHLARHAPLFHPQKSTQTIARAFGPPTLCFKGENWRQQAINSKLYITFAA
jgi:hypothetical protein